MNLRNLGWLYYSITSDSVKIYNNRTPPEKKNAPSVAAEGAESNIRASTLDGFILLAVAKKSILFVNYALFL
jgi:hypothetical protein